MHAGTIDQTTLTRERPCRFNASAVVILLACSLLPVTARLFAQSIDSPATHRIIVAIDERPDPAPMAGSTSRGYGGLPNYSGGERTLAASTRIAREHGLTEVAGWTIDPLGMRCTLYKIAPGSQRDDVLARLQKDRLVRIAQPLHEFSTQSSTKVSAGDAGSETPAGQFNDPYVALQDGFVSIGAARAQLLANGEDIRLALIDTGVDSGHADLKGRIGEQRDFAEGTISDPGLDRHGTEVAGVIAAVANNGIGIVGVAPAVRLHSYRACWPVEAGSSAAQCNSFTLAQALAAAIEAKVHIINLSLGGPRDPLLEELLDVAFKRGIIVVGATSSHGNPDGFPSGVPGVIAVSASVSGGLAGPDTLSAPGQQILTLEPGGSYDYASGSSLATAHVSGTIALLLQLAPSLDATALIALLKRTSSKDTGQIDACAAVRSTRGDNDTCGDPVAGIDSTFSAKSATAPAN